MTSQKDLRHDLDNHLPKTPENRVIFRSQRPKHGAINASRVRPALQPILDLAGVTKVVRIFGIEDTDMNEEELRVMFRFLHSVEFEDTDVGDLAIRATEIEKAKREVESAARDLWEAEGEHQMVAEIEAINLRLSVEGLPAGFREALSEARDAIQETLERRQHMSVVEKLVELQEATERCMPGGEHRSEKGKTMPEILRRAADLIERHDAICHPANLKLFVNHLTSARN